MSTRWMVRMVVAAGCGLLAASQTVAAPADEAAGAVAPDLLKGEGPTPDAARPDWFLHFYGTHGWIHGSTDAERNRARQILITRVPRFSEVRGALRPGDVLLGVNGEPFSRHPVFQFRESSAPARDAGEGLTVTMWRPGWDAPRTLRIEPRDPRPDFTAGDTIDLAAEGISSDHNLGPTGVRGWMFDRMERAHQILVTQVDAGSPADGILQEGDVILGVGDEPFEDDARRRFAAALMQAETDEGGGRLQLLRWREGATGPVTLQLEVLGTYSETAPWDCEKSERIIERAVAYLERRGTPVGPELGIQALVASLGLLATGEERVLPLVREHVESLVRRVAEAGDQPPPDGLPSWSWGYANMLLSEYHLATGDRQVLPAIEAYSRTLAQGQAMSGTWGHGMAPPDPVTGELRPLGGYGTMNQSSTTCWISLLLARRCGVTDPVIERAIRNKRAFLNDFIDVGTITYGDNLPGGVLHDDNGKTSAAAVGFALLGDEAATDFFSRMTVASHSIREYGHTGHFWSDLWGGPGAARAGREAAAAFLREDLWRIDLERRWDGGFGYQPRDWKVYANWDTTGSRLILFSLPRRQLGITGRDTLAVELTPEEIAEAVEAGRQPAGVIYWPGKYDDLPTPELLPLLGHWSPVTREQAARAQGTRDDAPLETLRAMLGAENRYARYGACKALRHLGPRAQPAVGDLIALLDSQDRVLQFNAIQALGTTDDPRAVEALFDLAGRRFADDPYDVVRRRVAGALFGRGNLVERARAVEDRERVLGATREFLTSITGDARTVVAHNVVPTLSLEEFKAVWPHIEHARSTYATTYNTEIHMATLRRLRDFRVREGIDHCVAYLREMKKHGSENRVPEVLEILRGYGAHARVARPGLERVANYFEHEKAGFPNHLSLRKAGDVRDLIRELEALEVPAEGDPLISIADGWR